MDKFYNIEAEQAVLGAMMTDNAAVFKQNILKPEHFYEPIHGKLFELIEQMVISGELASPITMQNKIDLGSLDKNYLSKVSGIASGIANILDHVKIVFDLHRRRELKLATENLLKSLNGDYGYIDTETLISDLHDDCLKIAENSQTATLKSLNEVTASIQKGLEKELPCYKTGIATIDRLTGGGFYARKNYCFAAKPKQGKTVLLSTIFMNMVKAGTPCAYICAEMGADEIHQRNISREIKMDSTYFLDQQKRANKQFIRNFIDYQRSENQKGWFVDEPGISFRDLQRVIMTAVRRKGVKGIFIDYFQLIEGDEERNLVRFHEKVAAWIAKIARKEGVFIVYAAQINKEKGDVRGGQAIEMNVDQLYHLHFNPTDGGAWLRMIATRYLARKDAGTKMSPCMFMESVGPYFRDKDDTDQKKMEIPL